MNKFDVLDWINVSHDRNKLWDVVNTMMNFGVP
jgi:hypothetical protein